MPFGPGGIARTCVFTSVTQPTKLQPGIYPVTGEEIVVDTPATAMTLQQVVFLPDGQGKGRHYYVKDSVPRPLDNDAASRVVGATLVRDMYLKGVPGGLL